MPAAILSQHRTFIPGLEKTKTRPRPRLPEHGLNMGVNTLSTAISNHVLMVFTFLILKALKKNGNPTYSVRYHNISFCGYPPVIQNIVIVKWPSRNDASFPMFIAW